jgi:hypothetical protein
MKCDDCLNLLEGYLDGEVTHREAEQLNTHLRTCTSCANQFELLTAEGEMYARYDRELEISPSLWNGIAARLAEEERPVKSEPRFKPGQWFAGLFALPSFRVAMPVAAVLAIAVIAGIAYWQTRPQSSPTYVASADLQYQGSTGQKDSNPSFVQAPPETSGVDNPTDGPRVQIVDTKGTRRNLKPATASDSSDVLYQPDDSISQRDTASHLERAQNLLVSIRNLQLADDDQEVDVSYEKSESRRLLNENIVLRREAESSGKFPAKAMLGSLEPFLIDIANLPDKAKSSDVRLITDRVQRTEIVAELRAYE